MQIFVSVRDRVLHLSKGTMLRYALFVYMILDCFYQAFGDPISVRWTVFYDVSHFMFAFVIAMWAALNLPSVKREAYIIMGYFGIVSVSELFKVNMSWAEYWQSKYSTVGLLNFSYLALLLISLFTIYKGYKYYNKKNDE